MQTSPQKMRSTVYAVGLGAELVARTVIEIAGNDISDSINKTPVTPAIIGQIAAARFQAQLNVNS